MEKWLLPSYQNNFPFRTLIPKLIHYNGELQLYILLYKNMKTLVLHYTKKRLRQLWKQRDERSEAWRRVHSEELHNVDCCSDIIEAISLQMLFLDTHVASMWQLETYISFFFTKNAKWIESLEDTDMEEMIWLKRILKAIRCEGVDCIDMAGNTVKLWKLINPAMTFGVVRKTVGSSAITQHINFIFHGDNPFLCL